MTTLEIVHVTVNFIHTGAAVENAGQCQIPCTINAAKLPMRYVRKTYSTVIIL